MLGSLISTATVLLLTAASAFAQDRGTALGGVAFGASPSAVTSAMAGLGLTRAALKDDSGAFPVDQTFAGTIDGRQVLVVAMYDGNDELEKMLITFITTDAECLPFYRDFKVALMREYGDTHADVEQWKAPFDAGKHVGHEAAAIRSGRGFVGATWSRDDLDGTAGMSLSVAGNLTVTLAYESSKWAGEVDRRRKLLKATAAGGNHQQ
jgi:opacity protein-like surface antigen